MKSLRASKLVKEVKFEGVWVELEATVSDARDLFICIVKVK